jgi:hypothetical protein
MDGDVPVVLHAWSGGPSTAGKATTTSSAFGVRALKALRTVAIGLVIAVVLLPIPVIHLAGIGIFLGCLGVAVLQLRAGLRVASVEGPCPHCGHSQKFWLGLNVGPMRFPKETSCGKCAKTLIIASDGA